MDRPCPTPCSILLRVKKNSSRENQPIQPAVVTRSKALFLALFHAHRQENFQAARPDIKIFAWYLSHPATSLRRQPFWEDRRRYRRSQGAFDAEKSAPLCRSPKTVKKFSQSILAGREYSMACDGGSWRDRIGLQPFHRRIACISNPRAYATRTRVRKKVS